MVLFLEKQKFIVRAHLYQARSLIGSDDSGLSGDFFHFDKFFCFVFKLFVKS